MAAGPNPQSSEMRLMKGRSPGRDSGGRVVNVAPEHERAAPDPPRWLPTEARAEWDRVVPGLAKLGLLKREDCAALTAYCCAWDSFTQAMQELAKGPRYIPTSTGGLTGHPALRDAAQAQQMLRQWASEIGLTPASESRLRAPVAQDEDDPFSGD